MQRYPLQWPVGYPRTERPSRSAFKNPTLGKSVINILAEINRLNNRVANSSIGAIDTTISSNVPLRNDGLPRADYFRSQIFDKGVAVYFKYKGKDVVMCCDKWDTVESNLHAVYLSIEALRSVERWGVSDFLERSFTGFKALPPGPEPRPWWKVLGMEKPPSSFETCKECYRMLVKVAHPDALGSEDQFRELNEAYQSAKKYFHVI